MHFFTLVFRWVAAFTKVVVTYSRSVWGHSYTEDLRSQRNFMKYGELKISTSEHCFTCHSKNGSETIRRDGADLKWSSTHHHACSEARKKLSRDHHVVLRPGKSLALIIMLVVRSGKCYLMISCIDSRTIVWVLDDNRLKFYWKTFPYSLAEN